MIPLESKTIIELIKVYKGFPCLWDQTNLLYNNKVTRRAAYETVLDKIKMCHEDITMDVIKKKIENMRTTYKREARKLKAARESGNEDYHPTLWYFEHMSFLNNHSDGGSSPDLITTEVDETEDFESGYPYEEYLEEEPKAKRTRTAGVFLTETSNDLPLKQDPSNEIPNISGVFLPSHGNDETMINAFNDNSEALAFGKTIGLQLKELNNLQRTIAEKLISETIFHARLNRLRTNSTINLDSE